MHQKTCDVFFGNEKSPHLQSTLGNEEVPDEELLARLLGVLGTNIFILDIYIFNRWYEHDENIAILNTLYCMSLIYDWCDTIIV